MFMALLMKMNVSKSGFNGERKFNFLFEPRHKKRPDDQISDMKMTVLKLGLQTTTVKFESLRKKEIDGNSALSDTSTIQDFLG